MAVFLFAMFQGGGNIALLLPIAKRLVEAGHAVRVLAGPSIWSYRTPVTEPFRQRIAQSGASFVPFGEPERHPLDEAPGARGIVGAWRPARFSQLDSYLGAYRWCPSWAEAVARELRRESTDVVVADHLLPGALAAAEAAGVPSAALVHGIYKHRPAPGLPSYGYGWAPARGLLGRARDALHSAGIHHLYRRNALPALNSARRELGLEPLESPFQQYDRANRVLILTSAAFDFPAERLPSNVRYVGTPFDDVAQSSCLPPSIARLKQPFLLVSLSTMNQGQAALMRRILAAVGELALPTVVTLGPALATTEFDWPPTVVVERFVPHAAVLPRAAAIVSQCGIGTLTKALAHGVPVVCLPVLGDQPDNAARVVAHGAGIRLRPDAPTSQIKLGIQRVLNEPQFRAAARRLAGRLASEDGAGAAARELELLGAKAQEREADRSPATTALRGRR